MRQLTKERLPFESPAEWLHAAGSPDAGGGLASAPLAVPVFFAGWVGFGVLVGLSLARRGHDRRTMVALGAGLGPLMVLVASDAITRREHEAGPVVLEPGVDHGGPLDILVIVRDRAEDVLSVGPTLEAVAGEVGTLTLASVVPYEWVEDGSNDRLEAATSTLVAARDLIPIAGPRLMLFPGTAAAAARRFTDVSRRTLVLAASGEEFRPGDRP